ncbi:MAG: hypothetical protein A2904_00070 [Candidatus Staskawiczbacteria bacterium RIFCSPLOWO2_01_FULL_33_9]|uniref:Uncharacterized protein n=1 Tax=Candidatus Staskawiczbacteria bacterium RIFCSPLOWO2_01_FULL_33_9 TaxID=1802211 RepID=A0A1G2I6B8_9BACT|nr:MAG: hypothetical protein A2904_00070 [Candidatus Staskawiczbacteria bacterium RIFCSPLOWO2_01_FULL_33_9]
MEFEIKNIKESVNGIMREIGYKPAYFQNDGEFSIVKQLGRNDYPRFHLYIRQSFDSAQDKLNTFIFNLHLDQKKPSYNGAKGHSGEYDGSVLKEEAERIKNILK